LPKDERNRVKLSFSDDELKAIDRLCRSYSRWGKRASSLHHILMELAETTDTNREAGTRGHLMAPTGAPWAPAGPSGAPEVPCPSPARVRKSSPTPDPEKKKTEKKRGGSERGGGQATLLGTEPEPTSEPFVQEVVGHLNEACGTVFPLTDPKIRELVAKLLAAKYTIEDMKTVNTWANENWSRVNPGEKDWRATFLVPSRLYGEKFAEHLGVAKGAIKRPVANSAGIPLDQMIGTPEYNARMGYTDKPKGPESK